MKYKGKEINFERITANTYEVYLDSKLIGIATETKDKARFYPMPEWKYQTRYSAATKTLAVGTFIKQYY